MFFFLTVVTNSNLREMCDNILQLLTKESMETVLWPYLIDFLLAPEYSNAIPAVIKSLSQLAFKMRQDKKASVTSVIVSFGENGLFYPIHCFDDFILLIWILFDLVRNFVFT